MPVHNGTIRPLAEDIVGFLGLKLNVFNSDNRFPAIEMCNSLFKIIINYEHCRYLFYTWSDKPFKGTVVNQALPSLHEL